MIFKNEKGFTVAELLIALFIGVLIMSATVFTFNQLFLFSGQTEDHIVAIRQVQNAGHWLSRDGMRAYQVNLENSGFPLTFSWTEWGEKKIVRVTYTLDNNILKRQEVIGDKLTTTEVARYITKAEAKLDKAKKLLTITITTKVGAISETRTYKIKPRPID